MALQSELDKYPGSDLEKLQAAEHANPTIVLNNAYEEKYLTAVCIELRDCKPLAKYKREERLAAAADQAEYDNYQLKMRVSELESKLD